MHPILEKLNAYLASATEDQLKADWEELKQYNVSGPEMLDVLETASQRLQLEQIGFNIEPLSPFNVEAECYYDVTVELDLAA